MVTLGDLKKYSDRLKSLVNMEGALYDELSDLAAGKSLETITDAQIKAYFSDMVSDKAVAIVRQTLTILEGQMPRDRQALANFDASDLDRLK